jgi:phenylalanyl-tRNA synthetase beta chain
MKFSENWLRTFVDPPIATAALADVLMMCGLDVEAVEPAAPAFAGVIAAAVVEVSKHPSADRLQVCRVDTGAETVTVVCGAPNVATGQRVALARVGAKLPGMEIRQARVRGVDSSGMLCSAKELGIAEDAAGLLVLPADTPLGMDLRKVLDLDDQLITIKPTPNRGDCLSMLGVAREVSAMTGSALKLPAATAVREQIADCIGITVDAPAACPRYTARVIRGVNAKAASPRWLLQRLERSGLRGISAIVDVTNYVMLELGQPLHAFDLARIEGGIRVRAAQAGESLQLLNGQNLTLDSSCLVIADEQKALALAGIMGGAGSGVSDATQDVLLESAFFAPAAIAGKARALGFGSDSSYRFERGVDFSATAVALERATQLILDICGGQGGPVAAAQAALPLRPAVRMRRARAERILGIELSNAEVADIFERLGYAFEAAADAFMVTPPSYRFDLAIEEDLIEEVARVRGYERIPETKPRGPAVILPAPETGLSDRLLRSRLVMRDYQEIVSYSFVDAGWEQDFAANEAPVRLANPIAAHLAVMRSNLLGSLVDCLKLNLSRQQERVRLFEIGCCYERAAGGYAQRRMLGGLAYGGAFAEQWGADKRLVDFYDVKSDLEALLAGRSLRFDAMTQTALHPGRAAGIVVDGVLAGYLGQLHPVLQQKLDFPYAPICFEINLDKLLDRQLTRFRDFPRQPTVRRDIAFEVAGDLGVDAILETLRKAASGLVCDLAPFDVYRGKGIDSDKKSVAFRVLLQDTSKTLTDAEVDKEIERLVHALQEEFQARLRK